jgi:carbonic anhydrase
MKKFLATPLALALSTLFTVSTTTVFAESPTPHRDGDARYEKPHAKKHASWGYKGSTGPENWGGLSKDFAACGNGTKQSPIDVHANFAAGKKPIGMDYSATELAILNNGHTVQVSYPEGSHLQVGNKAFRLLQFHFHAPSEHTIEGVSYPMEIHFVHQADDGELSVIGVMVAKGAENLALGEFWDDLPKSESNVRSVKNEVINARDLIPLESGFYRYMGSLTTPPCSEGVNWYVMKQPILASAEQIETFRGVMHDNNRPVQPVNGRLVVDAD